MGFYYIFVHIYIHIIMFSSIKSDASLKRIITLGCICIDVTKLKKRKV